MFDHWYLAEKRGAPSAICLEQWIPIQTFKKNWTWTLLCEIMKIIFDIACIILYLEERISEDVMNHECKTVWKYVMMYCIDTQAAR